MNGCTKINIVLPFPVTWIFNRFRADPEKSEVVIGITGTVKRGRNLNTLKLKTCLSSIKPYVLHRNINQNLSAIDSEH